MAKPKGATSYRLSADAQQMIAALSERLGLSKTAVLELAVRKLARAEFGDDALARTAQPPLPAAVLSQPLQN